MNVKHDNYHLSKMNCNKIQKQSEHNTKAISINKKEKVKPKRSKTSEHITPNEISNPLQLMSPPMAENESNLIAQSQDNMSNFNLLSMNLSQSNQRSAFSLSPNSIENLKPLIPPKNLDKYKNKKTLLIDLDETLVHSGFAQYNPETPSDLVLKIELENKMREIHVLIDLA